MYLGGIKSVTVIWILRSSLFTFNNECLSFSLYIVLSNFIENK